MPKNGARYGIRSENIVVEAVQDSKNKVLHVESTYFNTNKKAIPEGAECVKHPRQNVRNEVWAPA